MRVGKLDRPIVIESASLVQDGMGQEIQTWTTFHSCYARWQPMTGYERFKASGTHAVDTGKFTIRYKDGVLPTMRVSFDSKYYKITGIAEVPRRKATEITVELWQ